MGFKKGQSGNPASRAKGIPDKRVQLRALIMPLAPDLITACFDQAISGDAQCYRILLDKVLPNLKPETEAQPLAINMAGTASEQSQAILEAIAAGTVAPDTGAALIGAIASVVKIQEVDDLSKRLLALEETAGGTNGNNR